MPLGKAKSLLISKVLRHYSFLKKLVSAVKKKKLKKMSVTDPRIFQSIIKSITRFCLKYLHNFIIKYGEGYLRYLKLGGTIIIYTT